MKRWLIGGGSFALLLILSAFAPTEPIVQPIRSAPDSLRVVITYVIRVPASINDSATAQTYMKRAVFAGAAEIARQGFDIVGINADVKLVGAGIAAPKRTDMER